MILNGKSKEEFYKRIKENNYPISLQVLKEDSSNFYPSILNALIIDYFDSVEYEGSSSLWQYCFVTCYWDRGLKEYKQATIKAIKKANDIYNERFK